jgi:hypothetical protein
MQLLLLRVIASLPMSMMIEDAETVFGKQLITLKLVTAAGSGTISGS